MSSRFRTHLAARIIHQGGVVAYPTEAVYGFGCDPLDAHAVARLLELKQRPESKGLILIASHAEQLRPFVDDLDQWLPKIGKEWPGAHTFLLPAANDLPRWVNGGNNKIACRVTTHPDCLRHYVKKPVTLSYRLPLIAVGMRLQRARLKFSNTVLAVITF